MDPQIVFPLGQNIGLTMLDMTLLIGCPIFAALGTIVSSVIKAANKKIEFEEATKLPVSMQGKDPADLSEEEKLLLYNEERKIDFSRWQFYSRRRDLFHMAFIGFVLGLVIALYFVGAITQSVTSLARILALCVLLGYQAPTLWSLQEKALNQAIEKRLKELAGK